jgi:3-methyladenine DNA glycosylase/8-oxoguanine DNA glycosylase
MPPSTGRDGVVVRRGGVLTRLLHVDGEPVVLRAAQPGVHRVVIGAEAERADLCDEAIARMRFALGVDDDLRPFYDRFRFDPLIGPVVRRTPWRRAPRRAEPFEALAWAVTEQLIDYPRARRHPARIVHRLGRRCPRTGLRDLPSACRAGPRGARPPRVVRPVGTARRWR